MVWVWKLCWFLCLILGLGVVKEAVDELLGFLGQVVGHALLEFLYEDPDLLDKAWEALDSCDFALFVVVDYFRNHDLDGRGGFGRASGALHPGSTVPIGHKGQAASNPLHQTHLTQHGPTPNLLNGRTIVIFPFNQLILLLLS